MAVRIALQCSEADAHLILSEDNTAARLLTRPGEAIYNDANGMIEGNNLFQVVWLTDERREDYLEQIQEMSREQNPDPPRRQIVFEGNLPADRQQESAAEPVPGRDGMARGPPGRLCLAGRCDRDQGPDRRRLPAPERQQRPDRRPERRGGAWHVDDGARQHRRAAPPVGPQACRFYLLDGSPVDSPLSGQLGKLKDVLAAPGAPTSPGATWPRRSPSSRRKSSAGSRPTIRRSAPIYIFIYDIQRFRDLRKADDDFGYSRYDENKPVPPSKIFGDVLREGPPLGIHTMIWCDSVNNLNRTFDRQGTEGIRESRSCSR